MVEYTPSHVDRKARSSRAAVAAVGPMPALRQAACQRAALLPVLLLAACLLPGARAKGGRLHEEPLLASTGARATGAPRAPSATPPSNHVLLPFRRPAQGASPC